ncbi:hypothetical protein QTP88_009072 [Uroleucon formosanum]
MHQHETSNFTNHKDPIRITSYKVVINKLADFSSILKTIGIAILLKVWLFKVVKLILCPKLFYILFYGRKTNRWHVHPIFKERKTHGHYHCLLAKFQLSNSAMYNFLRMSSISFEHLVQLIGPSIQTMYYLGLTYYQLMNF